MSDTTSSQTFSFSYQMMVTIIWYVVREFMLVVIR